MSAQTTKKRPTTLKDLGMEMIEDTVCVDCHEGNCHTKAVAKGLSFHKGTTWYIHIRVRREACEDLCGDFKYIGDFRIDIDDPRNKNDMEFPNELTCVNYLLENFVDIKCSN